MENLTEKVYECTLAVEAHMICDLLSQAGIDARVVGAFLAGAGGELPLGNTVKVCVASERAAEARQVIADWEKLQTGDEVPPVTAQGRVRGLFWFGVGMVCGGIAAIVAMNMIKRPTVTGVDYNRDGRNDTVHLNFSGLPGMTAMDRNLDGVYDAQLHFDSRGFESHMNADDDFAAEVELAEEQACEIVEDALFKKAVEDGHFGAMVFWLINRSKGRWQDTRHVNITAAPSGPKWELWTPENHEAALAQDEMRFGPTEETAPVPQSGP